MPNDPYYKSANWKALVAAVWRRAHGVCEAPGCMSVGKVVDHRVARHQGGRDALDNLRLLCRRHDNSIMQGRDGKRARDGVLIGADATGNPCDPNHAWHGGRSLTATGRGCDRVGPRPRSKLANSAAIKKSSNKKSSKWA